MENLKWISVKNQLPKLDENQDFYPVIAVVNGETWTGVLYMKEGNKFILDCDTTTHTALNVTYWMDIPKPPNIDEVLPIDIKKFIEWLFKKDEWHYDSTIDLWRQDGYRSRTTNELYLYYRTNKQFNTNSINQR
jgi:hypothetical protein